MRSHNTVPMAGPGALLAGDWSGPDLISNSDRTAHDELVRRRLNGYRKHALPSPPAVDLICTEIRHEAFLDNVEQALRHSSDGLILRLLDIHEVGREIRRQTERHSTPRNWQPHPPEDAQPAGYRWTDDESVRHAPSLHLQLFNTQVTTQGNPVQAGGLWHGMVSITSPPQICRRLTNWSCCCHSSLGASEWIRCPAG